MHNSIVFFVVTETSLYRVEWEPEQRPVITKVAMDPGHISRIPVGECMHIGDFVSLRGNGLITYLCDQRQPLETVIRGRCVDNTSGIVGLFFDEDDARRCLHEAGIQRLDPRFRDPTKEVLAAISDDHPIFVISPGSFDYPDPSASSPAK